jgi:hypothetical protein
MSLKLPQDNVQRALPVATSDVIHAFAPHLHHCFANEQTAAICALAQTLWPFSAVVLERYLGRPAPRADLSLRITRPELRGALAQGWARPGSPEHALLSSPRWQAIRDFLEAWMAPGVSAFYLIENVWLELTIDAHDREPVPSIFFDMDRTGMLTLEQRMAAVHTVLKLLCHDFDPASYAQLRQCVERALPELRLHNLGLVPSQQSGALRVSLLGKRGPAIVPCLERLGWRDDAERLSSLLARYSRDADKMILDVDVSMRAQDPIAIELFWSPQRSWEELFSLLEGEGLCRAEEAQAILAWPGKSAVSRDPRVRALASAEGQGWQALIRRLSHVKLSFVPSDASRSAKELCAKAYLYLGYA